MLISDKIPNQKVHLPLLQEKQINLSIKRLDLIHPLVSGNKFYKLKHNLLKAKNDRSKQILTFGGAFSNHIYAVAAAAQEIGMKAIGVIRGEETRPLNPTLTFAKEKEMRLYFMDRNKYRLKDSMEVISDLQNLFGSFYLIPEGGTNALAIKGTSEILTTTDLAFDHITVPIGTGGTFAGLAASISAYQNLIGFSALKGDFIHQETEKLFKSHNIKSLGNFQIIDQYHFGGYAKHHEILIDFIMAFYRQTTIPLDLIYTGKMMFGLMELIKNDFFERGTKILTIHTGGLQGNLGFNSRNNTQLPY